MSVPARPPSIVTATLTSAYAEVYRRFADRPAVVGEDGASITYAELGSRARSLAGALAALGIAPGDRVMTVMANRPEQLVVDHALAAGGFVRVALSYRLHAREIAGIARDCEPRILFVDREREVTLTEACAAVGCTPRVIAVDDPLRAQSTPLAELLAHAEVEPVGTAPEQLSHLPYTSGTTGEPKGVMLSHRSVLACARNVMVELDRVESDDVVLHVAPLTHLSGYLSIPYALRGAANVCPSGFEPVRTLELIAEHGVTVLPAVPTLLNLMLSELETGRWRTDTVHTVIYGGSAIAPERARRLVACMGEVFVQAYGLTEVPFPLASLSKHEHRPAPDGSAPPHLASAGRVNPFVEVRIMTADGTLAADGEEGEIQARGDTTMTGYWNRPEATAEMLLDGGWAATGDVGRMVDGFLYIVDRKKDMIVSGGFNVFPAEVEAAISALEGVEEVVVIGAPHPRWGEAVKAVVVVREGHEVSAQEIDEVCRERIAPYKRPRDVSFVSELPRTGTGKLQRHVLREREWADGERRVGG